MLCSVSAARCAAQTPAPLLLCRRRHKTPGPFARSEQQSQARTPGLLLRPHGGEASGWEHEKARFPNQTGLCVTVGLREGAGQRPSAHPGGEEGGALGKRGSRLPARPAGGAPWG